MQANNRAGSPNNDLQQQQQLRRQQSLPAYEKPPRLQQAAAATRMESFNGSFGRNTPPQSDMANNFVAPPTSTSQRADPPRAIIFPEPKAPVNQFGAIGCKVPVQPLQNQVGGQGTSGIGNSWVKDGQNNMAAAGNGTNSHAQTSELGLTPASLNNSLPGLMPGGAAGANGGSSGLTIMQELQAERRMREQEFRRHNPSAPQWPGFGPEPVSGMMLRSDYLESLWDSHAAPASSAGQVTGVANSPSGTAAAMLGRWGTIGQNLWPSGYAASQQHMAGYTAATTSVPPPPLAQQMQQAAAVVSQQNNMMTSGFGGVSAMQHTSPPPPLTQQQMMNATNAIDPLSIASIWAKNNSNIANASNNQQVGNNIGQQRKESAAGNTWSAALFSANKNKDL